VFVSECLYIGAVARVTVSFQTLRKRV